MQRLRFFASLRLRSWGFAATTLLLSAFALGSCTKSGEDAAPAPAIALGTSTAVGKYLTDGAGNTLYYFAFDVSGSNSCGSAACAAQWPVFYAPTVTVGTGLDAADFTAGKTAGGENQTFYKGWPLYYYAPVANGQNVREAAGEIKGEGYSSFWYVVRPDYTVMIARASITDKNTQATAPKRYLIDPQGRTLYTYAKDSRQPTTQPTNCAGGCATAWPVFYQEKIVGPSSLKPTDFGTITRPDGPSGATRLQTTYKGMPLYYYAGDGNTRGKASGNTSAGTDPWLVVNP